MTRPLPAYPWLTEGAITFLETFLAGRNARVLEFGSGGSTLWLAERAAEVATIEEKERWAKRVRHSLATAGLDAHIIVAPRPYADAHQQVPGLFDLVLVDGRDRVACVRSVFQRVAKGGVLMLDNAERARYAEVMQILGGWQHGFSEQNAPRKQDGFWYPDWRTDWWVR